MFYSFVMTNTDTAGNTAHVTAAGSGTFIDLKPHFYYFSTQMKSEGKFTLLFKLFTEITILEPCSQRRLRLKVTPN